VRSINLLRLALDAEMLRLRAMATRQGRRAAFGSVALVFTLAVLAFAEIAGWQGLRLRVEAIPTTLILLGIKRRRALDAVRGSLLLTAALPAATTLLGFDRRGGRRRSWFRLFRR
jgi:hypothetical protein